MESVNINGRDLKRHKLTSSIFWSWKLIHARIPTTSTFVGWEELIESLVSSFLPKEKRLLRKWVNTQPRWDSCFGQAWVIFQLGICKLREAEMFILLSWIPSYTLHHVESVYPSGLPHLFDLLLFAWILYLTVVGVEKLCYFNICFLVYVHF